MTPALLARSVALYVDSPPLLLARMEPAESIFGVLPCLKLKKYGVYYPSLLLYMAVSRVYLREHSSGIPAINSTKTTTKSERAIAVL